ncbi:hypothetical protein GCM10009555_101930 [Acrocarpospora macrocephala]|uniref:Uncharacterized protein n=1 Tax=Acrocarpospora macrocephala TaxID=150177 RepID=A0A5M3WDH5_9ACTN|nr:hypothetical protein Amac_007120 [Acrocarpospora macrocephala]
MEGLAGGNPVALASPSLVQALSPMSAIDRAAAVLIVRRLRVGGMCQRYG